MLTTWGTGSIAELLDVCREKAKQHKGFSQSSRIIAGKKTTMSRYMIGEILKTFMQVRLADAIIKTLSYQQ